MFRIATGVFQRATVKRDTNQCYIQSKTALSCSQFIKQKYIFFVEKRTWLVELLKHVTPKIHVKYLLKYIYTHISCCTAMLAETFTNASYLKGVLVSVFASVLVKSQESLGCPCAINFNICRWFVKRSVEQSIIAFVCLFERHVLWQSWFNMSLLHTSSAL